MPFLNLRFKNVATLRGYYFGGFSRGGGVMSAGILPVENICFQSLLRLMISPHKFRISCPIRQSTPLIMANISKKNSQIIHIIIIIIVIIFYLNQTTRSIQHTHTKHTLYKQKEKIK